MSNPVVIKKIIAREILDSRGNPTLEADVFLSEGTMGRASVPSGASTGSREALELRDGDEHRYLGKGVKKAVQNVMELIAPALESERFSSIDAIDNKMLTLDGTEMKSKLGANAILGVSMAATRALANHHKLPLYQYLKTIYYEKYATDHHKQQGVTLPIPMMNILNGGKHADNNLSIQEFMILPSNGKNFHEALRVGVEVFHQLKKVLVEQSQSTNVGDEGGFAPNLRSNQEALECINEAIARAGYRPGHDVCLALDVAASEFREPNGTYVMKGAPQAKFNANELVAYYAQLAQEYPIVSIEDGLGEDDWQGWSILTKELGKKIMLVGDDLFVTNAKILQKGIDQKIANAILIKLNQIGSVSETLQTIALARKHQYNTVISHRSGETEDCFLADLAVATDAGLVKTGSGSRGERIAKYNQFLRIEEELGSQAHYNSLQTLGMKF